MKNYLLEVKIKIWGARYLQNGISYSQMDCGKVNLGADISRIVKKFVPRTTVAIVVQSGVSLDGLVELLMLIPGYRLFLRVPFIPGTGNPRYGVKTVCLEPRKIGNRCEKSC